LARSSRAPISFEAATAVAKSRGAVQDRLTYLLSISSIEPSPRNPRQKIYNIAELADSLREHGLLQPVVVRRRADGYELIAGHRRFEAAKLLGWTEIATVVRDETDDQAYILTLVENLQREDLSPKEEAAALEVLMRERGWSTRQVGEAVKRSHMYVSKRLRVFEDATLAAPVLSDKLAVSTAEELLRIDNPADRRQIADRAVAEQWGQSRARREVREWKVTFQSALPDQRSQRVLELVEQLRKVLAAGPTADLNSAARRAAKALATDITRLSRNSFATFDRPGGIAEE
jgi:ParB family chromosome partitioning protein